MSQKLELHEVFLVFGALCRMLSAENLVKLGDLLAQLDLTFSDIEFNSDDYTEDLFTPYYNKESQVIVIRMPDCDGPTVW